MGLLRNLLNYSRKFLIYIFVRYLSYCLLKIHRKLTSGYLLCDKTSLLIIDIVYGSHSRGTISCTSLRLSLVPTSKHQL
jgi:hypothetical protein